jgi:hypothetical protein
VLSGMLLHVIPTPVEVNILPDASSKLQRLRRVINAPETLTLNRLYGDWFHRRTGYRGHSTIICRLPATWKSVSPESTKSREVGNTPSGNSTESVNSMKYIFSDGRAEVPPLEELLDPFVFGGEASTQEMTSESIVRRYESRWQARSPTTRPLSFGGNKGIVLESVVTVGRASHRSYRRDGCWKGVVAIDR